MKDNVLSCAMLVCFCLFTILCNNSFCAPIHKADTYIPLTDNSIWVNIEYGFEPPAHARVYVNKGDTLINEQKHTILGCYYIDVDNGILSPLAYSLYLYEDKVQRKVYQFDPYTQAHILCYDFSLQVGDTFLPNSVYGNDNYILRDISYIENAGYTRKQFIFTSSDNSSDSIVWIEGIGNYTILDYPPSQKHPETSRILCVHNDGETIYDTSPFMEDYECADVMKILESHHEDIPTTPIAPCANKILHNGQIYIIRGDKTYTVTGQEIK